MKIRRLNTPEVTIYGRNFIGIPTWVRLHHSNRPGWFWKAGDDILPVSTNIASARTRRLTFHHGNHRLSIVEHLLALRFWGLDEIIIEAGPFGLPFDGCAEIFLNSLKGNTWKKGDCLTPVALPSLGFAMNIFRRANTTTRTSDIKDLRLEIFVDYPGIGSVRGSFVLTAEAFEEIARTPTLGWPPGLRVLAKAASFLGWAHAHRVVWPQEHNMESLKASIVRHRTLDFLGALALALPAGCIFSGVAASVRGGHGLELSLARLIEHHFQRNT